MFFPDGGPGDNLHRQHRRLRQRRPQQRRRRVADVGALVPVFSFLEVHLMALSWLRRLLKRKSGPVSHTGRKKPGHARFVPAFELLDERVLPAVTATFLPGASTLTIFGDALDNTITVSRDAAGKILVNGGAVKLLGGPPHVANVALIHAFGPVST